ncbi:MAG: RIP metalloprotease RseP [Clostridia bacterium]|nr:RIP metalloprotease RseP [Clostridia bacterium]
MPIFLSILIMILMLSVLTIVHELGHFICARIFKVNVVEFSIFMGPKLFARKSKKHGTQFTLRLIPLGGYCAFEDDRGDANSPNSLYSQKWYKRAVIFLGGVTMNFLLAWLIATLIVGSGFFTNTTVSKIDENSVAHFVGIAAGDRLEKMDGLDVLTGTDISLATYGIRDRDSSDEVMHSHYGLKYDRRGTKIYYDIEKVINYEKTEKTLEDGTKSESWRVKDYSYTIVRKTKGVETVFGYTAEVLSIDEENNLANCRVIKTCDGELVSDGEEAVSGENYVSLGNSSYQVIDSKNPFVLLGRGFLEMISMIKSVYISLWWIITGKVGLSGLMGPVGLTGVVKDVVGANADTGLKIITLANMAALISANLGVVNALPIPGLDGSHLLFIVVELIRRGKKIPPKAQAIISYAGLGLMILLAVVIAGSDVFRMIRGG